MKSTCQLLFLGAALCLLCSCGSQKPYYAPGYNLPDHPEPVPHDSGYSLFLAGGIEPGTHSPLLQEMERMATGHSGLVLLGDALSVEEVRSPGLDEIDPWSAIAQDLTRLDQRFDDFYILPGQKEWSIDKKISVNALNALDKLTKDVKQKGRLIVPAKECGQPEVIRLSDHTVLVLVDSQWAIETETHPGDKISGCELSNVLELRLALKDIIQSHTSDHIIIATHHPLFANGPTAGNYPLSSHLLPLPVLGTLITGIKSIVATNQHFGHPAYEAYRKAVLSVVENCTNCVVVSGHDKSLQYFNKSGIPFLVAGSGSEVTHSRKGAPAGFSYMQQGFVRLDELKDGSLRLSFCALGENGKASEVWNTTLPPVKEEQNKSTEELASSPDITGGRVLLPASTRYADKNFLRGNFYREAWSKPLPLPVLWLDSVFGGLKPLQLGGGNQTRSLRLENAAGEQYVLRSIDKKVTAVLPPELRGSFAENIVQDGIAASHPYGALVVPKLAKAAGVFYTNPSVVYVPHQAALGVYDADIGDGVYLFEERPGGKTEGFDNFGNTKKTFNTADVLEMITEDRSHLIDQKSVLRARLLDIWLGDWDRHDDQWRWAAFEENGNTVYRPIPRDRDQVFYKNDGILDYLASRPYFNPALRRFTDKIDHLGGLIWAAKYFDHSFLHQLTEEDFVGVARAMQQSLADEVIDRAFLDWPAGIDSLDGARIRGELRIRRDDLVAYAREFYKLISREVFIPATSDKDIIAIHALGSGKLEVQVDRVSNEGSHSFYYRVFDDDVTRELRIYGLNKQDSFYIEGKGRSRIRIRMIGGTGEDRVLNNSSHLHVKAYDNTDGMDITGRPVARHLNDTPDNNSYDRTDWNMDRHFQFVAPTYFTDEGLGLTYTYWLRRYGFRADPFKSNHIAALSYFFGTGSFIGKYSGEWRRVLGDFDLGLNGYFTGPTYTQYFYGFGNEYVDYGEKKKYHIVSGSQIKLEPSLSRRFGFGSTLSLMPSYQYINVEDEEEEPRFIHTPESGLTSGDFGGRHYLGMMAQYRFERIDNAGYPTRGGHLAFGIGGRTSIGDDPVSHALVSFDASLYLPFDVMGRVVLATHIGADRILGDYDFIHALTLGGQDRLRGFKLDRFAGDARFFQATDLRILLINKLGAVPFRMGIYGAVDYGRVWYEEDESDAWHTAFGGGLYLVPLGMASFRIGYMQGEDDVQVNVGGSLRF